MVRSILGLLLLGAGVQAHYKFPRLIIDGVPESADWQAVRKTAVVNSRDNGAVSNVNSMDMRCFGGKVGTTTKTVTAGTELGFKASSPLLHFGPASFYMAKAPPGANLNTWDADGQVWFKVGEISAVETGGPLAGDTATWPSYQTTDLFFTIPSRVPNGEYLVRIEHIGLHLAQNFGGAQIYIACGQVNVTGGGDETPAPLASIPGAFPANDPGLLWPYAPARTTYTAPGPDIWS